MSAVGKIHSLQSLGTLDGPGVRYVVFMQGCNLRCKCCHNPDTWETGGGTEYTAAEIFDKVNRFREYFGNEGGITISGGEPLLQSEFCTELFALCKRNGINTCLDTSGSILNENVKKLLSVTDRVLLDIKYMSNELYEQNVGCTLNRVMEFLQYLNEQKIPTTVRQVIIPTVNETDENIEFLKQTAKKYNCIDKIELLPFRKVCQTKYDALKIDFPFKDIPEPTNEKIAELKSKLGKIAK